MTRKLNLIGWSALVLALLLNACSERSDSLMGPGDAAATRHADREPTSALEAAPQAPDTLFASVNATHSISITFEDKADNEDGFWICYHKVNTEATNPGYGELQLVHMDAFDAEPGMLRWATAEIEGLEPGSIYRIWVEAYNEAGSNRSQPAIGRTAPVEEPERELLPPVAPDTVFASMNATHSISVAFEDKADNEDGYWICYAKISIAATDPGYGDPQRMHVDAFEAEPGMVPWVTANIEGLEDGAIYRIWVEAYNEAGTSRSKHAIGYTQPDRDDDLVAQRGTDHKATAADS